MHSSVNTSLVSEQSSESGGAVSDYQTAQSPEAERAQEQEQRQSNGRQLASWKSAIATACTLWLTAIAIELALVVAFGQGPILLWVMVFVGPLAIGAIVFMGFKGTSWKAWRRLVWPWILGVGILTPAVVLAQVLIATAASDLPRAPRGVAVSIWEKTTHPSKRESVEEPTGLVHVSYSGIKACYNGQEWHDCVSALVDEYNFACLRDDISPDTPTYIYEHFDREQLTVCEGHLRTIQEMQGMYVEPGSTVISPNSEKLQISDETKYVRKELEPARTRLAVCVFGQFGDCN